MTIQKKLLTKFITLSRVSSELLTVMYERRHVPRHKDETAMEYATRRFLSRLLAIIAATIRYNPALSPRFAVPVSATLNKIASDLAFD